MLQQSINPISSCLLGQGAPTTNTVEFAFCVLVYTVGGNESATGIWSTRLQNSELFVLIFLQGTLT